MSSSQPKVNKIGVMGWQASLHEPSKPTRFNSQSYVKVKAFLPGRLTDMGLVQKAF